MQLAQHTSLTPRQLRNGLGVLFQQNLLYTITDNDSRITSYDANPDACYNLVRSGKILEVIDKQFGSSERDLVQTLLQLGHARVHDLTQAFAARAPKVNGHSNGLQGPDSGLIESEDHLHTVLAGLIQADIIERVGSEAFRNPVDVYKGIKDDVTRVAPGEKISKSITDTQMKEISKRWCDFRDKSKELKRSLGSRPIPTAKRRKLQNGRSTNGDHGGAPRLNVGPRLFVRQVELTSNYYPAQRHRKSQSREMSSRITKQSTSRLCRRLPR